jgi:DNA (cytosine-5)-methyltransferase 1
MEQYNFAEFFAGVGLVRLALEKAGGQCVFANDLDKNKLEVYQKNFSSDEFILEDIWKVNSEDIPNNANLYTASFPCVDLSVAGNRKGLDGARSGSFWAIIEILRDKRKSGDAPKVILLENVYGFLTTNNGEELRKSLLALNDMGYLVDTFIVDAKHFTPQSRVRLFVVAIDEKLKNDCVIKRFGNEIFGDWEQLIKESDPELRPKRLLDFMIRNSQLRWFTLRSDLLPKRNNYLPDVLEEYDENHAIWWNNERKDKILSQIPERQLEKLYANKDADVPIFGTIYRRMRKGKSTAEVRLDGVAGCLRTPKGGSSKQILARSGNGRIQFRLLSPREYARLQGVDDTYVLAENDNKSYFAMGDAVCVQAIRWIAENYLSKLLV